MMMPDENGLEFAKRLKDHAKFSRMRIIIATSLHWQGDMVSVRDAGIEAVLTKPIRRHELVDTAARAISGTRHLGWRGELMSAQGDEQSGEAAPRLTNFGANVLLAEDNPVNIEVAKEFLAGLGCRVSVVSNGLEAVAATATVRFDIILMDCQMPVMDGMSATRRIRSKEQESGCARTPIVAVTANAFAEDRAKCLEAGMDDYLSKPFSEQHLCDVLGIWLRPQQSAATLVEPSTTGPATPRATPAEASNLCDPTVLNQLRASRPDLQARLIKSYLQYAPKAVSDLIAAAEAMDFEALAATAHSLKSSSANLGAIGVSSYCRKLERVAGERQGGDAQALVLAIAASFEHTRSHLEREAAAGAAVAAAKVSA